MWCRSIRCVFALTNEKTCNQVSSKQLVVIRGYGLCPSDEPSIADSFMVLQFKV